MSSATRVRCIATEEAFVIPELNEAMAGVVRAGTAYDPDIYFWQRAAGAKVLAARLLDLHAERLAIMDANGVDMQLLSLVAPGVQMLKGADAAAIARIANDRLAEAIVRHPYRYAGLATVAPQTPEEAARELERAVRQLRLHGVLINSHTDGQYLDEPKYRPILEAAAALKTPIYLHPRAPIPAMAGAYRTYTLEHAIWGFQAETGLHGLRLIVSGLLDRLPDLRIVLGHGGEGLPYWLSRIDTMHRQFQVPERPQLAKRPSEYFRENFVVTTSGMNWGPALRLCIDALGADKVLFAIDYPFQDTAEALAGLNAANLAPAERAAILHRNAERVFGIAVHERAPPRR
ncbi:MAG TPA: amidohydrolase family protein [Steroidobacteraceae bacterium]|nr:amidohydrolase family protein [Steroidobacteraceae bacterium]